MNQIKSNRNMGISLSFVSLLLLGLLPIISNSRPSGLDAISFAFYLSLWELFFSLPLFIYELRGTNKGIFSPFVERSQRDKTLKIIVMTGIIFSISTLLYVVAFEEAGTITAAIAIQTYPLFAIITEAIILRQLKTRKETAFTLLLLSGIYYLGTQGTLLVSGFNTWFFVALGVPILWSIAHVTIKIKLDNSPITPNQVTFIRVLIASVVLGVLAVAINGPDFMIQGFNNREFQTSAMLMGLVYYLELVNWFYAIKYVNVSVASSITTPTPVVTMILAIIFLNDSLLTYQIISMIIVIISLYGLIYAGRDHSTSISPKLE
ncbi:MAG: DMT family transporter [Candidatus Heimdallarchaeota archaeon]|nr:DMT family transporter [Candidatus Heimdallarchaeota archaeon]